MRVLLVEDDEMIGEAMSGVLRDAAHAVNWVRDGRAATGCASREPYDLVLLDLGLPYKDGEQVLAALRAAGIDVPVIVVSARDALDARVRSLDAGADDFIVKPFEMAELLARIRAVIRRRAGSGAPLLGNGAISLDQATREAFVGGSAVRLSGREFALLHSLLLRPGAILSRSELEDHIYGWNEEVESNAVEFLIHSIRKKLGNDAIRNVRGLGWMVAKGA